MFYSLITTARDDWYSSKECGIHALIGYMQSQNKLRDAQIDAIKTYLYLKIACKNKPLWQLFSEGYFSTLDNTQIDNLKISSGLREYLKTNNKARFLYSLGLNLEEQFKKDFLRKHIDEHYADIDYEDVFKALFYGATYTDYLFSLPMGAGKTYLMASFIYLDLHFAHSEPNNKAFAHNFIVLAPSGLKSSIIPSLKSIEHFDVTSLFSEPYASDLKKLIKFEILDESKKSKKSTTSRNPNVEKISIYQPYEEVFGLVLLTNAEKVILEHFDKSTLYSDLDEEGQAQWRNANELRDTIAQIPNLSILVDEVHHAASDDIKLRQVIKKWQQKGNLNMVAGFSGTPYLGKSNKLLLSDSMILDHKEIINTVYYYPLIKGVGNFLKVPNVRISHGLNRLEIIESGLREFFENSEIYANKLGSKIAIYCGNIENLEEQIYPKVCEILADFGLDSANVLRFHQGNKSYPKPKDSEIMFANLDQELSPIKVILLVGIGKEGWDCKSLSGVILSQEKDCPTNMVLQTSCRCLRQVTKNTQEKALIYLNEFNAKELEKQLKAEQRISLKEFQSGDTSKIDIKRYDRSGYLALPRIDFYQLRLDYEVNITESANPKKALEELKPSKNEQITETTDLSFEDRSVDVSNKPLKGENANFNFWLYKICKQSFHTLTLQDLEQHKTKLKEVFGVITFKENGDTYFDSRFDRESIESYIRKAFCDKRDFIGKKELIPQSASILITHKLTPNLEISPQEQEAFIPSQDEVARIIDEDSGKLGLEMSDEERAMIERLKSLGHLEAVEVIQKKSQKHPYKDKTYHYLPYHTDSAYEREVFQKILELGSFTELGLEAYYNGDSSLSEFKIHAFKGNASIGRYTPDFLILQRNGGKIYKILIIETKGSGFAQNFNDKRAFMTEFINANNEKFAYEKLSFLYLQDDIHTGSKLITQLNSAIEEFFTPII